MKSDTTIADAETRARERLLLCCGRAIFPLLAVRGVEASSTIDIRLHGRLSSFNPAYVCACAFVMPTLIKVKPISVLKPYARYVYLHAKLVACVRACSLHDPRVGWIVFLLSVLSLYISYMVFASSEAYRRFYFIGC